jgi:hypothetical protein
MWKTHCTAHHLTQVEPVVLSRVEVQLLLAPVQAKATFTASNSTSSLPWMMNWNFALVSSSDSFMNMMMDG